MRCVLIIAALAALAPAARADEADDKLARQLGKVVRDPREPLWARVEAARTIGKLGPTAAAAVGDLVAVLERLRGAEQEPLQEAVIDALGDIGSAAKSTLPSMARAAARSVDIDLATKRARDAILNAADSQDIELLMRQLASRDASARLRAAKALGDLGSKARAAVPAINAILTDADDDVRRGAIAALRLIDPAAKPSDALIRAIAVDLKNPDANFRLFAIRALGKIGSPAGIVAADIDALRTDPDPDVRRAAFQAVASILGQP